MEINPRPTKVFSIRGLVREVVTTTSGICYTAPHAYEFGTW